MTTGPPAEAIKSAFIPTDYRRTTTLPRRFEEVPIRQQAFSRPSEADAWAGQQRPSTLSFAPLNTTSTAAGTYPPFPSPRPSQWSRDSWSNRQHSGEYQDSYAPPSWANPTLAAAYSMEPISPVGEPPRRSAYTTWQGGWHAPLLRRTSSDDTRMGHHYSGEASRSVSSLQTTTHPQRRPSNRDEFDGPSQLLDKPEDSSYEPKEEDLPQLPITLYAQEQDDILTQVNDRLAQCAFDFVAKYQFPIPIEPDKRPVRVPGDREWSEWVYLLKRLATKRRIPARVLYNGQIKQLITILENSMEMRHAAKHQSRPLKDDRNILQLISSGLQVAKIFKDAQAMRYLDGLYVQTERVIASRRVQIPTSTYPS